MNEKALKKWTSANVARARVDIQDSPLATDDASARRGAIGNVEDVDRLSGFIYVDFGRGAIACYPEELI
jgi:hypothetical protein